MANEDVPPLNNGEKLESLYALVAGFLLFAVSGLLIRAEIARTKLRMKGDYAKCDGRMQRLFRRIICGVGFFTMLRGIQLAGNSRAVIATRFTFQMVAASYLVLGSVKLTDVAVKQYISLNRLSKKVEWNHSYGRWSVIITGVGFPIFACVFVPIVITTNRMRWRAIWLFEIQLYFVCWALTTTYVTRKILRMVKQSRRAVSRMSMAVEPSLSFRSSTNGVQTEQEKKIRDRQKKNVTPLRRFAQSVYLMAGLMALYVTGGTVLAIRLLRDDELRLFKTEEHNEYSVDVWLWCSTGLVFFGLWYCWAPITLRDEDDPEKALPQRSRFSTRFSTTTPASRKASSLQVTYGRSSSRSPSTVALQTRSRTTTTDSMGPLVEERTEETSSEVRSGSPSVNSIADTV